MKQLASSLELGPNSSGAWASHLIFVKLSFLICTIEMVICKIIGVLNKIMCIKLLSTVYSRQLQVINKYLLLKILSWFPALPPKQFQS